MTAQLIREFCDADLAALRECVVALQEFERTIEPRLRTGEAMADAYCEQLLARRTTQQGIIFVAEIDGRVAGFVAIFAKVPYEDLDDPPGEYALISDLCVLEPYRRRGLGRRLIERAEAYAWASGAVELRIGVLAANEDARSLYRAAGFSPSLEILTKRKPT
jgi:GNAT superfamily N-acetyltransferase